LSLGSFCRAAIYKSINNLRYYCGQVGNSTVLLPFGKRTAKGGGGRAVSKK
jgi:hypothetical protein